MLPFDPHSLLALLPTIALSFVGSDIPTVQELTLALEKTEATVRNLSVTTDYVKLQKFGLPVDKPVRLQLTTQFIVDRDGRSWYECVGEQVNSGPKPEDVSIYRGCWQATFDGEQARSLIGDNDGVFRWGGIDNYPSWHGVNPLEFTTHYFGKPVSRLLRESDPTVVEQTKWESQPVVLVDTKAVVKERSWKYRFWIDPARKIVVRRAALIQYAPEEKWQEYTRIESREHKEISPGVWLPMRVKYESLQVTKEVTPEELSWSYEGENSAWRVNSEIPAKTFRLVFPDNVVVTDRRSPKSDEE